MELQCRDLEICKFEKGFVFSAEILEDFKIKNGILWNTMAMKMLCLVTGGVKLILIIPSMSYSSLCTVQLLFKQMAIAAARRE